MYRGGVDALPFEQRELDRFALALEHVVHGRLEVKPPRDIAQSLTDAVAEVGKAITDYRFNDAAGAVYHFVWNTYCDWYVELAKPILQGDDEAARAEARATTAHVRDEILKLLHPDPARRYEDVQALIADLRRLCKPGAAAPAPGPERFSDHGEELARATRRLEEPGRPGALAVAG
mgnify:CR=1 FL=1